jgi:hypothetical protein
VGKGKDVYLEVRKRRVIYFLNETSACGNIAESGVKHNKSNQIKSD